MPVRRVSAKGQIIMSIQAGANTKIVATLREYGPVSTEFLAYILDREPEEVARYLHDLESKGVVEFRGEEVRLAPSGARSPSE